MNETAISPSVLELRVYVLEPDINEKRLELVNN